MDEEDEIWQVVSSRYLSKGAKASTEKKIEHGGNKTRPARNSAIPTRGKRGDRDTYREDARRTPKTQRTDETEAIKRTVQEFKRNTCDNRTYHSGSDVSKLIGRPVVLVDRPLSDSQQLRREEHRPGNRGQKGGLLFINPREVFGDVGGRPERREREEDVLFDVMKETWPEMSGSVPCGSVTDDQTQECLLNSLGWSDVVKSSPKPRSQIKLKGTLKKDCTDSVSDGDVDGEAELGDDEKDGRKKSEKRKKKKKKKKGGSPEEMRRSDQPITLALGDMFATLEQAVLPASVEKTHHRQSKVVFGTATPMASVSSKQLRSNLTHSNQSTTAPRNLMDSSAPTAMRGKEREVPKKKKPSSLRKVITKEKEEKKRLRELGEPIPENLDVMMNTDTSPSQAAKEDSAMDFELAQQDPIFPLPKGLHNRKFREYCDHMITNEINETLEDLLQDLIRFQDRVYHNDPLKYRSKRRYVCGLNETTKHLRLGKIRCVVLPPNLERIQSTGGINEHVQTILTCCSEKNIPVVFAMTRRRLGWVMRKRHCIGCIGIFSYAGSEQKFRQLMNLVLEAREEYEAKRKLGLPVVAEVDPDDKLLPDSVLDQSADEGNESHSEDSATEPPDFQTLPSSEWAELFESAPANSMDNQSVTPPSIEPAAMNRGNKTFFWNPNAPIFQPQFISRLSSGSHIG